MPKYGVRLRHGYDISFLLHLSSLSLSASEPEEDTEIQEEEEEEEDGGGKKGCRPPRLQYYCTFVYLKMHYSCDGAKGWRVESGLL